MPFDFRAKMIEKLIVMGWGYSKPSADEISSMQRYYDAMSDEDIFVEFSSDTFKAGQDSMSY